MNYKNLLVVYGGGTNQNLSNLNLSVSGGTKILDSVQQTGMWRSNAGQRMAMKFAVVKPTSNNCVLTVTATNNYAYTYNGTSASIIIYGL